MIDLRLARLMTPSAAEAVANSICKCNKDIDEEEEEKEEGGDDNQIHLISCTVTLLTAYATPRRQQKYN